MSTCPDCGGPTRVLFQTRAYCVLECDIPTSKYNQLSKQIAEAKDVVATPKLWVTAGANVYPWNWSLGYPTMNGGSNYTPAKGQCPKAMCRGAGKLQYSSFTTNQQNVVTGRDHYQCSICNHQYDEVNNSGIPATIP